METYSRKTFDRRFEKTERKIQQAIAMGQITLTPPGKMNVERFCEIARISRATFYRHYSGVDEALEHYISAVDQELSEALGQTRVCERVDSYLFLILEYVWKHRKIFEKSFQEWDYGRLAEALEQLRKPILQRWREVTPGLSKKYLEQLFCALKFGVFQEIEFWCRQERFDKSQQMLHVRRLNRLVEQLPKRRYDGMLPPLGW